MAQCFTSATEFCCSTSSLIAARSRQGIAGLGSQCPIERDIRWYANSNTIQDSRAHYTTVDIALSRLERDLDTQLMTQGYRRQELAALALPDRIFAGGRRGSYDPYLSGYRGVGGYTGLALDSGCVLLLIPAYV